jgi:uncharacterized membrane protein
MNYSPLVLIHICAASIGLLSGAPALFSRKGSRLHRAAGNVFFISILSMSATGAYMAAFVKPVMINVVVGVLTFYLVATAWLAIARKEAGTSLFELGLLFVALADGSAAGVSLAPGCHVHASKAWRVFERTYTNCLHAPLHAVLSPCVDYARFLLVAPTATTLTLNHLLQMTIPVNQLPSSPDLSTDYSGFDIIVG